jgi:ABC-type branched-subunit amino acid transport system ATPase component/ABC-type branched-subunit amino acid transport system permease subunit
MRRANSLNSTYLRVRSIALTGLTVAMILVLLVWPRITDYYSYNANYYNSIVASAAIAAILTVSLNLCMGYGGMLSMMQTALQLVGGYAVAITLVRLGWSWMLGLAIAVVVGALLSLLVLLVSLRATYLYLGMITLAADLIVVEIGRAADPLTGGVVGMAGIAPTLGDTLIPKARFYYVVLAFLAVTYIVQRNFVRSGAGRAAMAVRESPEAASAMGIRPATTKLLVFSVAGGIGGLAGGLYALQMGFINPDVGLLDNGLIFFVGLFLGGIGTLAGPLIGVAIIALVVELIRDYARYTTLILGLVLLVAIMLIPAGLVGSWRSSRLGRDPTGPEEADEAPGDVPATVPRVENLDDTAALEGTGLVKFFGGVRAVDDIDLRVMPGTVHGIIGPNGSGKSTLVACMTRFLALDRGEVRMFGATAPSTPHAVAASGVTRVFQTPHLFERLSVLDNVLTGMRMRERYTWVGAVVRSPGYRRQDRAERVEAMELLRFAGLGSRATWSASSLSHGQKRLLEVVRAVATRPRVLILDEPATGLTPIEMAALARLCRALRDRGLAVVLIEHNVDFVMGLCDEITVLDLGKVIDRGNPERIRHSAAVLEAYLGRPDLVPDAS